MITKRTTELCAGDRVQTTYGTRTVSGTEAGEDVFAGGVLIRVGWVREPARPYAQYAHPDEEWSVEAPSKLDLAVRRAQELADQWFNNEGITGKEITELMDMFREAR